ncbi:hypothetical protein BJV82DRAFT_607929 [Fennellomyces sp. T-0311]|nr:hypothetical protein BJV82DRAFT_607929 [Fennellomyces sp. T-0311]
MQAEPVSVIDTAECHPEASVPESMQKYWLKLSDEIKGSIVQILQDIHKVPVYKANNPADTSLFVAPFEADPQIIYLAENCQEKNCIYSHDSDLL